MLEERRTRNRHQRISRKVLLNHIDIESIDEKITFLTLMKLRLGFLLTDLSQQFRMYVVVFALKVFIHGMGKRWRKVIYLCREIKKS